VLLWAVFNVFFTIGSLPLNLVYIGIFVTVQGAFTLLAANYFLVADGKTETAAAVSGFLFELSFDADGACAGRNGSRRLRLRVGHAGILHPSESDVSRGA